MDIALLFATISIVLTAVITLAAGGRSMYITVKNRF